MLVLVYEDWEDSKVWPDFDTFADSELDDFHLPTSLKYGVSFEEDIDRPSRVDVVSRDKLQEMALEWHEQCQAEHSERFGI